MSLEFPEFDVTAEPLLTSIKARLEDLVALLDSVSSHGHLEDKFYRFYHQSFKLFALQSDTKEIVAALRALWPERELNPWFIMIISEGTDLEFVIEDNENWLQKGRPILEAFFHARTMLEFTVKYGRELDHAPCLMPSGWAALLELYGVR